MATRKPGRELVHFKVGAQEQDFDVHKDLICHYSPSFEAALTASAEDSASVTTFPEVNPETFELFYNWLYTQHLWEEKDQTERPADEPKLEELLNLYILSDMLNIKSLKNQCISSFMLVWNVHQDLPTGNIKTMWKKTAQDSPIRRLIRDTIAWGFSPSEIRECWTDLPLELQLDIVERLAELVECWETRSEPSQKTPFDHPELYQS